MDVCKKKVKPKNGVQNKKCSEMSEHVYDDLNKNCCEINIFMEKRRTRQSRRYAENPRDTAVFQG